MDYDKLIANLKKPLFEEGSYIVDHSRREAAQAITDLLVENQALRNAANGFKERAEKAEYIASDLCDDFTDFVIGGVPNAAPYCANCRPECVDGSGWRNGDNRLCKGFLPKAAGVKEE